MTRPSRVILLTLALLAAGCPGDPPPPSPPDSGDPAPSPELPGPPDPAEVEERERALRDRWNEEAHAILDAFRERLHDPSATASLVRATAYVEARTEGVSSTYEVTFDASREPKERVQVSPVEVPVGTHPGVAGQIRAYAALSFLGPYPLVIGELPPVRLRIMRLPGHVVVHAPPFRSEVGTSYRFDARGLVTVRGRTDGEAREVVRYYWVDRPEGAVLVRRVWEGDGQTEEFEYVEGPAGTRLLGRVLLTEGDRTLEVRFTYR